MFLENTPVISFSISFIRVLFSPIVMVMVKIDNSKSTAVCSEMFTENQQDVHFTWFVIDL